MESWTINNHEVEFFEDEHIYLVDGVLVPSVTTLLAKKYGEEYKFVSASVLQQASDKGTALHKAIEVYETTGEIVDESRELRNYMFIKRHKGFKNIANEIPALYEENGTPLFIGRIDQIIEFGGELWINDFKRVSTPNKEKITFQLNLYKMAYEQSYGQQIKGLAFTHLREDKRKFVPLPICEELTKELLNDLIKEN